MNPPAFQFYADDFIGGTVDLTTEEVGAYIRLLCYQWGHGKAPLSKEVRDRVAGCSVSEQVWEKFPRGKNARLESERRKQIEYRAKQAINGAKGGRPEKPKPNPSLSSGLTQTEPKKSSPSPSPSPSTEVRAFPISKEGGTGGNGIGHFVSLLSRFYLREESSRLTYEEESGIAAIVRERPRYLEEWSIIQTLKEREGRYFPQSLSRLVNSWQETLDRANVWQPAVKTPKSLLQKELDRIQ